MRIILLASALMVSFLLNSAEMNQKNAEITVLKFLAEIKKGEFEKAAVYTNQPYNIGDKYLQFVPVIKTIISKIEYSVVSVEPAADESVSVLVKITAPDMIEVMNKMGESFESSGEMAELENIKDDSEKIKIIAAKMNAFIAAELSQKSFGRITSQVDIKLQLENGKWKVIPDDELGSAILGSLDKYGENDNSADDGGESVNEDPDGGSE